MNVINEISYDYIVCPHCLHHSPIGNSEEYVFECSCCSTPFRVVQETVTRCTTSIIK